MILPRFHTIVNKCTYIYVGTHSHGQDIPDKKYNVKDVFPTDTLIDLFASKTIITA